MFCRGVSKRTGRGVGWRLSFQRCGFVVLEVMWNLSTLVVTIFWERTRLLNFAFLCQGEGGLDLFGTSFAG